MHFLNAIGVLPSKLPLFLISILAFDIQPVLAGNPAAACDAAARHASTQTGVPLDVLRAITRTETGRERSSELQPWPWTVNMEGTGVWFESEKQAQVYVFRHFKAGARSFDVGCFQVNYKWHGQAFNSIEEMFDPSKNALYAAGFLKTLYTELGDWDKAAGAYHSRTQKYAMRYLARFAAIRDALPAATETPNVTAVRENSFPLLRTQSGTATRGSLVSLSAGGGLSLFTPRDGG